MRIERIGGARPRPIVETLAADRVEIGGAPWGAAADGDGVRITDAARAVVIRVDAAGTVVRELATGARPLATPG